MEEYDGAFAPVGFGLNNTGVICYLNSFLQVLAGCTALTRAVLQHADYLSHTRTGRAVLAFVSAYATKSGARPTPSPNIASLSASVLAALKDDLAERRPLSLVRFGSGQECASETLVHILDMMEPPPAGAEPSAESQASPFIRSAESPITRLFLHRFRCELHCLRCKKVVSKEMDYNVSFSLFHFDQMKALPASVAEFSRAVRRQISATEDYKCPECLRAKRAESAAQGQDPERVLAETGAACRVYNLTMVPEILFCLFNLYDGYGGDRRVRYVPDRVEFPEIQGGTLVFRLVGQIEHTGSRVGGHYWARSLRANQSVCLLNDLGVAPTTFSATVHTYIVVYHYVGLEPAPAPPV